MTTRRTTTSGSSSGVEPPESSTDHWRELLRDQLDGQLARLETLGALTVHAGHARLTDLAAAVLREQVVDAGGVAPLVPTPRRPTPASCSTP